MEEYLPMNVAVELPDDIAQQLETAWQDMPRRVLEAVAVEGYRSGALTRGQVQRLLQLSWWETEAFLKERQAYLLYDEADLEQDRAALDRVLPK
jgi:predicted HTH domain antitoxin